MYQRRELEKICPAPPVVSPITEEVMLYPNPFNKYVFFFFFSICGAKPFLIHASALFRYNKVPENPTYTQVVRETLPQPGDELAIDSEFVLIRDEEVIERPGGVRTVVRPSEFSLARVSVLETKSRREGTCIIDDYIATKESSVVDYLTKYSGIRPGDLNPQTSPHHVTTLKVQ